MNVTYARLYWYRFVTFRYIYFIFFPNLAFKWHIQTHTHARVENMYWFGRQHNDSVESITRYSRQTKGIKETNEREKKIGIHLFTHMYTHTHAH